MPFSADEIKVMDQMANQMWKEIWSPREDQPKSQEKTNTPTKEKEMNVQEKSFIKSFMEITHGPGASLDDLIMAAGYFHAVEAQILVMGLKVPIKLADSIAAVDRDLNIKLNESRAKELASLEAERRTLLTNEEKLRIVDSEIAKLKEEMKKKI